MLPTRVDLLGGRIKARLVTRNQSNRRAFRDQRPGDSQPDPPARASHHGSLASQLQIHHTRSCLLTRGGALGAPSVDPGKDGVGHDADYKRGDSADDQRPPGAEFLADPADDRPAHGCRA